MEKKEFEAAIGKAFTVTVGGKEIPLNLVSVDPLKKTEGFEDAREEPFSLVFTGPEELHLQDDSYEMSIEGHGEKVIFISAHKKDHQHIYYDSVFN